MALQPRLTGALPGLRRFFETYPFICLEQKVSKAVGLRDAALWAEVSNALPTYLDSDGLANYFPPRAGVAQRLGVEQVGGPAAVEPGQHGQLGVAAREGVQIEQFAHRAARAFERFGAEGLQRRRLARFVSELLALQRAAQRGEREQRIGHEPPPGLVARGAFAFDEARHRAQRRLARRQQQGEAVVELALGAVEGRHRIEAHLRVQCEIGQQRAPFGLARDSVAHEVQHRQHRLAAGSEDLDLAAELGEHRLARVDHEQRRVDFQQRAQHLGFLLEGLVGGARGEEGADALRRRHVGAQRAERVQQADRIFQPRRVEEAQAHAVVAGQLHRLDVARGAGLARHLAEIAPPRQRAQQRSLAGIGVADHGEGEAFSHGGSVPRRRRRAP